jgi:nucleoside-diphosphate-sugar epimerase
VCEEPSFSELEWARKIVNEMHWQGEFVVLPVKRTPRHLLRPGNPAQHWTASSARVRHELGYEEPITIDEAVRRTIRWEQENPPAVAFQAPFDYAAEDAAIAGHDR